MTWSFKGGARNLTYQIKSPMLYDDQPSQCISIDHSVISLVLFSCLNVNDLFVNIYSFEFWVYEVCIQRSFSKSLLTNNLTMRMMKILSTRVTISIFLSINCVTVDDDKDHQTCNYDLSLFKWNNWYVLLNLLFQYEFSYLWFLVFINIDST